MKVAVAMSGGVDSSVAAKILKEEGHELIGLFLKLWSDPLCKVGRENRCCDYRALEDARSVAASLDIPFYVINAQDEFKKEVVDYFLQEYKNLRTPNPCIVCNHKIKFGLLLKRAQEIGCDKLATGHYARIEDAEVPKSKIRNPKSEKLEAINYMLKTGIDGTKDQSYMLYHLNQDQLSKILFPLGNMTKKKVRSLAKKWDLPVKEKPESQEICFFGDKDYRSFLRRYLPEKYFMPGKIVDGEGAVLGEHQGLVNYTIGQRRGIAQDTRNKRQETKMMYVIGYNVRKNQLIVSEDKDVYKKEMIVKNINWISGLKNFKTEELKNVEVKIRYRHEAVPCKLKKIRTKEPKNSNGCHCEESATKQSGSNATMKQCNNILVVFDQPQRAITPGQSAVFYKNNEVLGGGVIS